MIRPVDLRVEASTGDFRREIGQSEAALRDLIESIEALRRDMRSLSGATNALRDDMSGIATSARRAAQGTRQAERGFERAGRQAGLAQVAFGAAAGALAALGAREVIRGIARAVTSSAALGDELVNLSAATGLAVRDLQVFRLAFEFGGTSSEQFAVGLSRLNREIARAAQGSALQVQAFRRLGIELRDSTGELRGTGEVLREIFEVVTPETFRELQPALQAVFGDDAIRVFASTLQGTVESVDALANQVTTLSQAQAEALAEANRTLSIFAFELRTNIAAAIADNAEEIEALIGALTDLLPLIAYVGRQFSEEVEAVRAYGQAFSDAGEFVRNVFSSGGLGIGGIVAAHRAELEETADAVDDVAVAYDNLSATRGGSIADLQRPLPPIEISVPDLSGLLASIVRGIETDLNAGTADIERALGDPVGLAIARGAADAFRNAQPLSQDDFFSGAGLERAAANAAARLTQEYESLGGAVEDVDAGFGQLSQTIASGLSNALVLSDNFGDSLRNLGSQLVALVAQAAILAALGAAFGLGGGAGFSSLFGSLLGFQQGGRARGGTFGIVGEQGRELVFFPRDTEVIPNPETEAILAGAGGPQVALTVNVAPGTDAFEVQRAVFQAIPELDAALSRYQRGRRR